MALVERFNEVVASLRSDLQNLAKLSRLQDFMNLHGQNVSNFSVKLILKTETNSFLYHIFPFKDLQLTTSSITKINSQPNH